MNVKKLRDDFPVFQKKVVYFDNACMTFKPRQVIAALNSYYTEFPACGERSEHQLGKIVTEKVEEARRIVARFINAAPEEIIFTKNTTEAINLVAHGLDLKKDDVVLTTDKEHNSNLLPWRRFKHEYVKSKADNTFDLDAFEKKVKGAKLVAMGHTSNLDGVSIPAEEIIDIAHKHGALVLLDGAQSVPHKGIDVRKLDVDFLAFSGHKMCGPTGTGVLYGKLSLLEKLKPFIVGGGTVKNSWYDKEEWEGVPHRFEAGLQDYAGIIGLGEACKYLQSVGMKNIERHELELNKKMTDALAGEVNLIGPKDPALRSGIFSFNIEGMDMHEIAGILDNSAGIAVRAGNHCVHSWFNAHNLKGSVRASVYFYNTLDEVERFVDEVKKILKFLK
ncbi:cysteine desulfurase [Candidatus Woesearchaeota archaeon]|nr:cysteine desulfurase [Candidatus Woesearchaeota archaeon]MBW3016100.1 cysteine desulfurase [Candidatus Woesearchaeota archaeon]